VDEIRKLCGYGLLDQEALFESSDQEVTLYAESSIPDRRNHIYELPLPDDFLSPGRRDREITVSLAFMPAVSTTRLDYLATKLSYRLVRAANLEEVSAAFSAETPEGEHEAMPELNNNRSVTVQARSRGTVQSSRWGVKTVTARMRQERLFVVVTRSNSIWGGNLSGPEENYALVVRISDRENATARLYAQIRARLEARLRQRIQV
jgi:hypothetical protein